MSPSTPNQRAYESGHASTFSSINEQIYHAMYSYLRNDLGLSENVARSRSQAEVDGHSTSRVIDECVKATSLTLNGKRVLDLGAGLGGVATELVRRGASTVALEPGTAWRNITSKRMASVGDGLVINAVGESIPLESGSIDLIISLQVLEHVQNPRRVIEEAYRILKPGGYFFFAYENYLSFYEPHYRVKWLPLLPKRIGSMYLKSMGRNPEFLNQAVTYTTFPSVRRYLHSVGFQCDRKRTLLASLRSPDKKSLKWRILKLLASSCHESTALALLTAQDYTHRIIKTAVYELVQKPHA